MKDWSGIHPIVKEKHDTYDDEHVYGSNVVVPNTSKLSLSSLIPFYRMIIITRWLPCHVAKGDSSWQAHIAVG